MITKQVIISFNGKTTSEPAVTQTVNVNIHNRDAKRDIGTEPLHYPTVYSEDENGQEKQQHDMLAQYDIQLGEMQKQIDFLSMINALYINGDVHKDANGAVEVIAKRLDLERVIQFLTGVTKVTLEDIGDVECTCECKKSGITTFGSVHLHTGQNIEKFKKTGPYSSQFKAITQMGISLSQVICLYQDV